ncbi:hypothetical protein [Lactobacillus phage Lbab1]|nr:hypothetical protein [Lactobacillus phage Lbab1]
MKSIIITIVQTIFVSGMLGYLFYASIDKDFKGRGFLIFSLTFAFAMNFFIGILGLHRVVDLEEQVGKQENQISYIKRNYSEDEYRVYMLKGNPYRPYYPYASSNQKSNKQYIYNYEDSYYAVDKKMAGTYTGDEAEKIAKQVSGYVEKVN